jgi:NADPH:quinone reductase-like Zn-dependent oxidoreductase
VEEGRIIPVISTSYPMKKASEALMELESEGIMGRLVLTLNR